MSIVAGSNGQQVSSLRDLNESSVEPWLPIEWVEARSVVARLTEGRSEEWGVSILGANEVPWLHSCLEVRDVRLFDLPSVTRLEAIVRSLRQASHGRVSATEGERLELLQVWLIARRMRLASPSTAVTTSELDRTRHFVRAEA